MTTAMCLLAVDDTPTNLFVLEELVGQHLPECVLVTANHAEEGLALAAEQPLAGALIDVQMPGIDGLEMCRRLKADPRTSRLPVLLITSHGSTAAMRADGLKAGADDFISRPIDNVELTARIRTMLRIRRAEDELRQANTRLEEQVAQRTRALQEKARLNQILLDSMPCIALLLRPRTREIVASNEAAANVGAIPGTRCFATWAERDNPCPWCLAPELWATGEAQHLEVEAWGVVWDAHWIPVSDDLYMHYAFDVTERKRSEEQLARAKEAAEAANRAKSAFLANMSHEIRTPMSAILGFADILMSNGSSPEQRREYLQIIHRNAESLLAIINDILDLSKIEAEKLDVQRNDCRPTEIVDGVQSLLQVRADQKGLALDASYVYPLPRTIRTDPVRLRQILINLIGNAIKFTEKGAVKITVRSARRDDGATRLQFEISDTGIGISDKDFARLFQPFTQVEETAARRFGGTGLGLDISQRLARLLGGRIDVQSEPDKGSTFTLTIDPGPLDGVAMLESPPAAIAERQRPVKTQPHEPLQGRILLAEDDENLQALLIRFLENSGLEVDLASNGRIAYDMATDSKARGKPYDVILMDIRMPEMDGHEVTRRLRRDGWVGPIIAQTAHALTGDREKCLDAGCDDYMTKPVTPEDLYDAIARHLKPRANV